MRKSLTSLIALTFLLAGCDRRSDIAIANEENILIIGNKGEPKGLDLQLVSGVMESNIITALFEGLCVQHPSEDTTALPGAAQSWEHNEDYSEWTFFLQPNGKWSDGVPLTAHDFAFSYRRMLSPDPAWPAKYGSMLYYIENAEAYHKNQLSRIFIKNDPDFPTPWEEIIDTNLDGDDQILPEPFAKKSFADLEDFNRAKFLRYLEPTDSISFKNLTTQPFDKLTAAEKKIALNAKGLDSLDSTQLQYLKNNLTALRWADGLDDSIKLEIIDRLLKYRQLDPKPDLWDQARVGIEVVDDYTLKLFLRGPVPFLPEITKHYTWFPVPKHTILKHGKINTAFASRWTTPENIVSNGAFKLKTWRTNHLIELERNPHYWDRDQVGLDGIRYLPIGNGYTETRMYVDDQLHITYAVPAELIPFARENFPEQLRQEPYVGTRFCRVNTRRDPFKDPMVRRAFALAIDQQAICDKILMGGQTPASGIIPPLGNYPVSSQFSFQPEEARRLLKESTWGNRPIPSLTILTTDTDAGRREAEALQGMWKEHLDLDVRIIQREWTTYLQLQRDEEYDISVAGWIGDFLDPTTFLEMWRRGDGNNNTGWSSQKFEDLLNQASQMGDPEKRIATLAQAEDVFLSENPILPIYFYTTNYLIRPEVQNWQPLLLNNHPFKFVTLKK